MLGKSHSGSRSQFLELSAELCVKIYGMVAEEAGAKLRKHGSGSLCSPLSLMRVSRRAHDEYQDVLNVSAGPVTVYVRDFDFSHLVRSIKRMSERELKSLPSLSISTSRKVIVLLNVTKNCPQNPEKLQFWILRRERRARRAPGPESRTKEEGLRRDGMEDTCRC